MAGSSRVPYALAAYAAISTGAIFLLLSSLMTKHSLPERLELVSGEIGMVLMAVGGAHLIYDKLLREETEDRSLDRLQRVVLGNGLRLVDIERTRSHVYQLWVINDSIKDVSIIGRSVLHRMNTWAQKTFHQPIDKIILDKLKGGGELTILFLDPSTPIINQLVSEEGPTSTMFVDLRKSLEICANLAGILRNRAVHQNHSSGHLKIAVYKDNSTFAYHRQGSQVLIGFYPLNSKGERSPVYEAIGTGISEPFDKHFEKLVQQGTTTLIDYKEGRAASANVTDIVKINALLKLLP